MAGTSLYKDAVKVRVDGPAVCFYIRATSYAKEQYLVKYYLREHIQLPETGLDARLVAAQVDAASLRTRIQDTTTGLQVKLESARREIVSLRNKIEEPNAGLKAIIDTTKREAASLRNEIEEIDQGLNTRLGNSVREVALLFAKELKSLLLAALERNLKSDVVDHRRELNGPVAPTTQHTSTKASVVD
ncbi:hypothetical protein BDU57DRAFT_598272 [Ampelomyces quisqualis]|uniref:Uncharacterized protein n=1 Tax=Ampelomyces quisqualis TaxID=50730 RepID=A0A6A5QD06_AMPQU|nr:hypothetical protein BDU57DRAFT_598272 [Ampelomyces quisqualis]